MTDYPFKGRWFYCELCRTPSIKCKYCGNTSCNGGGCEICHEEFTEANRLVDEDKAPLKEDLEIRNKIVELDAFFNTFKLEI